MKWHPSPNFAPRTEPIRYVIVHGTWMDDDASALQRLCDTQAEVSCHYMITYDAETIQLVKDDDVAWHAGKSQWGDLESLNKHSIGIEISYQGEASNEPYLEAQYEALEALLTDLLHRHRIPPEKVLGHSDIAPHRKDDPGRHFDWVRLERKGLAAPWVPSDLEPLEAIRAKGYRGDDKEILMAFQRRYLPNYVTGELCPITAAFIKGEPEAEMPTS